jgi:hypothetical protein
MTNFRQNKGDKSMRPKQGDQIGRIFACWVVVYLGQFREIYRSSHIILALLSMVKVFNNF